MQKTKLLPYLEALFAVIVWGGSFTATKIAVGQITPIAVVWLRFAMGIPLILLAVVMRKQFAFPKGSEWLYFALLGFLGISLHQWLQSNGLKTAQATTTAWIVSTSPAFIAVLGWMVLKEKLNLLQSLGIVLAMIGVLAVVSKGDISAIAVGNFGTWRFSDSHKLHQLGRSFNPLKRRIKGSSVHVVDVLVNDHWLADHNSSLYIK
ncbi:MAG: DMT family transporter [Chloroflexi bacterium]|nr:DMT family transporter [Chloroflexota bacterium]